MALKRKQTRLSQVVKALMVTDLRLKLASDLGPEQVDMALEELENARKELVSIIVEVKKERK